MKRDHEIGVLPEGLLAGRVPDLELDLFALDVDHPSAKLDADRQIVNGLESLVSKLKQ